MVDFLTATAQSKSCPWRLLLLIPANEHRYIAGCISNTRATQALSMSPVEQMLSAQESGNSLTTIFYTKLSIHRSSLGWVPQALRVPQHLCSSHHPLISCKPPPWNTAMTQCYERTPHYSIKLPHHVPESILQTFLEFCQAWCSNHFPGEPVFCSIMCSN